MNKGFIWVQIVISGFLMGVGSIQVVKIEDPVQQMVCVGYLYIISIIDVVLGQIIEIHIEGKGDAFENIDMRIESDNQNATVACKWVMILSILNFLAAISHSIHVQYICED